MNCFRGKIVRRIVLWYNLVNKKFIINILIVKLIK